MSNVAAPSQGELKAQEIMAKRQEEDESLLQPRSELIRQPIAFNNAAISVLESGFVTITRRIPVGEAISSLQNDLDAALELVNSKNLELGAMKAKMDILTGKLAAAEAELDAIADLEEQQALEAAKKGKK